jgi:hypothetical protein
VRKEVNMKRKTLGVVRATLLLVLSRLEDTDPDRTHTQTLINLVEKTKELARLAHKLPIHTDHTA